MTIKAVIWDMGGVILRTEDRRPRAAWEERLDLAPGDLDHLVFMGEASQKATLGEGSAREVWSELAERFDLSAEERAQIEQDFWSGDRVDRDLLRFIRELRPKYKTALLSNAWPNVRPLIENKWGIADAFDEIVISAEAGLAKPDPRIYRLTLSRLGVNPDEGVFIDDFTENVEAARRVGMRAILFTSPEQATGELQVILEDAPGVLEQGD